MDAVAMATSRNGSLIEIVQGALEAICLIFGNNNLLRHTGHNIQKVLSSLGRANEDPATCTTKYDENH